MTPSGQDWHPADIAAALSKKGWKMEWLSTAHSYSPSAVSNARTHAWPAVEKVIADALELQPQEIWPSRYNPDGTPKRGVPVSKLPPRPRRRESARRKAKSRN